MNDGFGLADESQSFEVRVAVEGSWMPDFVALTIVFARDRTAAAPTLFHAIKASLHPRELGN
jgi:hypothetical protein